MLSVIMLSVVLPLESIDIGLQVEAQFVVSDLGNSETNGSKLSKLGCLVPLTFIVKLFFFLLKSLHGRGHEIVHQKNKLFSAEKFESSQKLFFCFFLSISLLNNFGHSSVHKTFFLLN